MKKIQYATLFPYISIMPFYSNVWIYCFSITALKYITPIFFSIGSTIYTNTNLKSFYRWKYMCRLMPVHITQAHIFTDYYLFKRHSLPSADRYLPYQIPKQYLHHIPAWWSNFLSPTSIDTYWTRPNVAVLIDLLVDAPSIVGRTSEARDYSEYTL